MIVTSSIRFNKSDCFDLDKAQTKVIFDRSRGGGKISKVPLRIPTFPVENLLEFFSLLRDRLRITLL